MEAVHAPRKFENFVSLQEIHNLWKNTFCKSVVHQQLFAKELNSYYINRKNFLTK